MHPVNQGDWPVVGLTGGIGAGKSRVAGLFAERHIPCIDMDTIGRELTQLQGACYTPIRDYFLPKIPELLLPNGELNRALLREFVFTQTAEREWLEQLLQPRIGALAALRLQETIKATSAPFGLLASALLFEKQIPVCKSILVYSRSQRARALARDGSDPAIIDRIMALQMPVEKALQQCDYAIDNSFDLAATNEQVSVIYRQLCQDFV